MDCCMTGSLRCVAYKLKGQETAGAPILSFDKLLMGTTRVAFVCYSSPGGSDNFMISRKYSKYQLHLHSRKKRSWRRYIMPVSLDAEPSLEGEKICAGESNADEDSEKSNSTLMGTEELKSLLEDSERIRLVKKLSEANQHNRYLKRQLQSKDDELVNLKSDLAILEDELQALVGLAEEVANSKATPGTRQISGKYIQSHLHFRLEAATKKLKQHIKGVDLIKFQHVDLFWVGVAESVQVKGSFDGWSEGEEMSQEYDGSHARFSITLKLRPGSYEIKFLVDGQWQLSPELPTVGEGLMKNNLLVVSS